jgi:hypothetical protein
MGMSNADILAAVDAAVKTITITDLSESILTPEKQARFVRSLQARTTILPEARYVPMTSQQADIDRVAFLGRIMVSGSNADGSQNVLEEADFAKPNFATNKLIAKELQAVVGLRDDALRRNIERGGFENTLVDLLGEAAGRDMEEWAILADTDVDPTADLYLSLTDGWAKQAANKVYGVESAPAAANEDFDPTDPEAIFDALIGATPKQYFQDRAEWRFYVPFEVEDAYRDILRDRGTALGDTAQTGSGRLQYKGIPVVVAPIMERSAAYSAVNGTVGRICMLQHPDNMAWGIFHRVTIEPERSAKGRRTDFVLTVEGDAGYEDENAASIAYLDVPHPVA